MKQFNASSEWGTKKQITALKNPISEFNARGGLDLDKYQAVDQHLELEHPNLGSKQWEEIKKLLPPFELIEDPKSGQKLRIQKFNWPDGKEMSDQIITFMNMPFSVPADPDHIQYEHYLLAKELNAPLVVFENPAYGDSDKLTSTQKETLKKNGNFGPIAESMLGIAKVLGTQKANFIGYSMGAETAAAMAANAADYGITVDNLFVMEGPGVQIHKPLKLARDFMSDAQNLKFTWKHPIDPVLREVGKLKPGLPKGILSYGRAMIKGSQEESLVDAIETQPNMKLTIASAGASKISPLEANNSLYQTLRLNYPERSIRRIVIPGEGHAYGDSGERFANLGKLVLRDTVDKYTKDRATIAESKFRDISIIEVNKRLHNIVQNFRLKNAISLSKLIPARSGYLNNSGFDGNYLELAKSSLTTAMSYIDNNGTIQLLSPELGHKRLQQIEAEGKSPLEAREDEYQYIDGISAALWQLGFLQFAREDRYSSVGFNPNIEWESSSDTTQAYLPFDPSNELHLMLAEKASKSGDNIKIEISVPNSIYKYAGIDNARMSIRIISSQ